MRLLKKIHSHPIILLLISIPINLLLSVYFFGTYDVDGWIRLAGIDAKFGIIKGYNISHSYYPPLSSVVFWIVGLISKIKFYPSWLTDYPLPAQIGSTYIPIKLSIFVFLYITSAIVFLYLLKRKKLSYKKAILITSIIYFNPAYIFSGPILGYVDLYFAAPLLLAFVFVEKKSNYFAGLFLALAFFTKLLPILLPPLFLSSFININLRKHKVSIDLKNLIYFCLGMATVTTCILIFFRTPGLEEMLIESATHAKFLSNNATNLNFLLKIFIYHNGHTPQFWLLLSRVIFITLSSIFVIKLVINKYSISLLYKAGIGIFFAYYIFITGAHENHFFPALVLATGLLISQFNKINFKIFLNISLINFLNLFVFYQFGQTFFNSTFSYLVPRNYGEVITVFAVFVSIYSIFYFFKFTLSFLRE